MTVSRKLRLTLKSCYVYINYTYFVKIIDKTIEQMMVRNGNIICHYVNDKGKQVMSKSYHNDPTSCFLHSQEKDYGKQIRAIFYLY